jgi:general secretion pathway protein G
MFFSLGRQPAARRGVTLLELVFGLTALVVVIMAGSWLLGRSRSDRELRSAERAAEHIYSAAEQWQLDHPGECPTLSQLMYDDELDRDSSVADPWGSRYRVVCEGGTLTVCSSGQDRRNGTKDDIRVPRS